MSTATDYLIKIPKNQHAELFALAALNSNNKIDMKVIESKNVYSVQIHPSLDHSVFSIKFNGSVFGRDEFVTFKIEFDLKIYFFKAKGIENTKSIIFDKTTDIFELVRRKEIRYRLPPKWMQSCVVISSSLKTTRTTAEIIEISASGMKLLLPTKAPPFEVKQKIKLQFAIHKRAQVNLTATIKHSSHNLKDGITVGVQFEDLSRLVQSKIQNILDDLTFFYVQRS